MASENSITKTSSSDQIMSRDILTTKPWVIWVLIFAFWTIISTVLTIQDYYIYFKEPELFGQFTLLTLPLNSFLYYYFWFALTPLVFWFGNKFPIGRDENSPRNMLIHIPLSIIVMIIYIIATTVIMGIIMFASVDITSIYYNIAKRIYVVGHFQVLIYWAILGLTFSLEYYKKYREREVEASRLLIHSTRLESQLVKAQLDSLKMQLHPHFLFNTLHAISALIEDSPKRARTMIARLGELLRSTLDITDQQTITLEKEITLTKLYLSIEQERFGEMLEVKIDASPNELKCFVPSLILQPLIENAIKHGIKDDENPAHIGIKVRRENKQIKIFVEDDGPGFPEDQNTELQDGIGLSNTKARLEQLYRSDHNFTIQNSEKGGVIVEISIPCSKDDKDESK